MYRVNQMMHQKTNSSTKPLRIKEEISVRIGKEGENTILILILHDKNS